MTHRTLTWAAAALGLLAIAASGCGDREGASTATPAQTGAVEPAKPGEIRTVNAKQIRALVDERKGKVVVVNFWASWCPPCMREFPAIIKVYEQYRDKGLDMFAVSMNAADEKADIEEFVRNTKPPFPIYLADTQDETFNESVLEKWYGEMPLTLVFNAAGERVLAHRSELTFEELSTKVKALLPGAASSSN